jgi:hypothetical protein
MDLSGFRWENNYERLADSRLMRGLDEFYAPEADAPAISPLADMTVGTRHRAAGILHNSRIL